MNRADNMLAEGIRAVIRRSSPAIGSNAGIMGLNHAWIRLPPHTPDPGPSLVPAAVSWCSSECSDQNVPKTNCLVIVAIQS
jgi:hypothetical protein